jgi:outer membrane protein assembly factor BamB
MKLNSFIIVIGTFTVIFISGNLMGQNGGDLIWQSSADWVVNSIASTNDANGDGVPDVFAGSADYRAYCFSGSGNGILWSWNFGAEVNTVASIPDINGDGVNDCLAGGLDNTVYCLSGKPDHKGLTEILWSQPVNWHVWTLATIGDVDGDGIRECLAGAGDNTVYCFDGAFGDLLWSYMDTADILTVHAIPDVNSDGYEDCLVGGHGNRVLCISGGSEGNGELLWYYMIFPPEGTSVLSVAPIEDVNGDGIADCLASGLHELVYCISGASSGQADLIWSYPTGANVFSVASISDVNGDGFPDCLAGGVSDKVFCISGHTGTLIWSFPTAETVYDVNNISDVNGDGFEDCVAGGADNKIHCINGKAGNQLWEREAGGTVRCVEAIPDLNRNGLNDVIAGSDDSYIYAVEGGTSTTEVLFDPSVSGKPVQYQLLPNYPNPFNQMTIISVVLPEECEIRLDIFNLNGELVSTPILDSFPAGKHKIRWNGEGLNGVSLASGCYLIRLKTDAFSSIKRMILIK